MIALPTTPSRHERVNRFSTILVFFIFLHACISFYFLFFVALGEWSRFLVVLAMGGTDIICFVVKRYRLRLQGVIVICLLLFVVEYCGIRLFDHVASKFSGVRYQYDGTNSLNAYGTNATSLAEDHFSIIIPCRDEDEYITRTIQYTIENTPRELLRDIIVVDDASARPLNAVLDSQLSKEYRRVVKVYRFNTKQGLIRARMFGADVSTSPNLVFLDGHCRPKPGWLLPLLKHLKTHYKRIVCPTIQDIHRKTWEDVGASGYKMMFQWNFEFSWYDDYADEVPIAAGGVLAITRRWWEESGKYDPGMLEWGGENIEQSMRVWMCGGEIYVARDSLVGHIFSRPAKPNPGNRLVRQVQKNQKRAALVWLDDYYKYFERFHSIVTSLDEGPGLEDRFVLRHRLGCKSFQWFVDKFRAAFERKGLLVDESAHLQHEASGLCLTASEAPQDASSVPLILAPCLYSYQRQEWQFIAGRRMLYNSATTKCADVHHPILSRLTQSGSETSLVVSNCRWNDILKGKGKDQFWQFDENNTGRIFSSRSINYETPTGNDRLSVNSSEAQHSKSYCLTSQFTSVQIGAGKVTIPSLNVAPCLSNQATLLVNDAFDPQRFRWFWVKKTN